MRALGVDPVTDTRDTFRALVDAMSRPGTVQSVPTTPADHAVLSTLVDQECTLQTPDSALADALEAAGRYVAADPESADVVHVRGTTDGAIREFRRGDAERPDRGATVVYRLDGVAAAAEDGDVGVRVSGPGVPGQRAFAVDGLPVAELRAVAAAQSAYPLGVDCVLTASDCLACLPRSVELEVI